MTRKVLIRRNIKQPTTNLHNKGIKSNFIQVYGCFLMRRRHFKSLNYTQLKKTMKEIVN